MNLDNELFDWGTPYRNAITNHNNTAQLLKGELPTFDKYNALAQTNALISIAASLNSIAHQLEDPNVESPLMRALEAIADAAAAG